MVSTCFSSPISGNPASLSIKFQKSKLSQQYYREQSSIWRASSGVKEPSKDTSYLQLRQLLGETNVGLTIGPRASIAIVVAVGAVRRVWVTVGAAAVTK
jgi:hypothetical protein